MIGEIEREMNNVSPEAWGELGSAVLQDGLQEAGYAVIPQLVRISEHLPPAERCPHLTFAGACVAAGNDALAAKCPDDLIEDLGAAKSLGVDLTAETLKCKHSPKDTIELLAAMAAFKDRVDLARFLFEMEYPMECPHCGGELEPLYDALNPGSACVQYARLPKKLGWRNGEDKGR
jgi:hypothetical protein